jgi:acyl transferase domain-containing protein
MGRRLLPADVVTWIPSLQRTQSGWASMATAASRLWIEGAPIDWHAVDAGYDRRRVALPPYPFERERFWIDESSPIDVRSSDAHPLLGRRVGAPAHEADACTWESAVSIDRLPYLAGHTVAGSTVLPYAAFVEMALAAGGEVARGRRHRVTALRLHHPVVVPDAGQTILQVVLEAEGAGRWRFRVYNRVGSSWTLSASASLLDRPDAA